MPFVELKQLPELEIARGIKARAVTAECVTVLHVTIEEGAPLPEHSHYHEQVVNVIEGELQLTVKGETYSLTPGTAMVLEPNVVHSGRAASKCRVVDVFHPVRQDFAGNSFVGYPSEKK